MVAEHLRGIEGAAEEAPAIAALLRDQQRREGVLAVDRDEGREVRQQRLQPAERRLDLAEVDAARIGRGPAAPAGGTVPGSPLSLEPSPWMPWLNVTLTWLMPSEAVGPVGVGLEAEAAQLVVRERQAAGGALVVGDEAEAGQQQVQLARADHRIGEAGLDDRGARAVVERAQQRGARPADPVAPVREEGQPLAVEHLTVGGLEILQLLELERARVGDGERLVRARDVVHRGRAEILPGPARGRAAIVDARDRVDRLLLHLDDQDRGVRMRRRGLQRGGELQARQVVRKQQVAFERAHVRRPVGRDACGVVGEEVPIARQFFDWPDHLVDIALDHLDADHRAAPPEILRRHDGARQHVAGGAVFRGDAAGEIVDRRERDLRAHQVGVERREVGIAVDGRAGDDDAGDRQRDPLRAGRGDRGGERDRVAAGLCARRRRIDKSLTLPAGRCTAAPWATALTGSIRIARAANRRRAPAVIPAAPPTLVTPFHRDAPNFACAFTEGNRTQALGSHSRIG